MITVITPGLLTTVQDGGRWGYQAYGMPVAGVMDRFSHKVANLLVGNELGAAALEMTMFGGTYHFNKDAYIAICGADMQAELNGKPVAKWSAFPVAAGSELSLGYASDGCRAYLAVKGGIDVPVVLGSRSTYTRAAIGGYEGRALKAGDHLKVAENSLSAESIKRLPADFVPEYQTDVTLRVLLGPQDDLFDAEGIATLFESVYAITSDADRMGYRLEGPTIKHSGKADIVSDALCQGAIQVPGHGMPIVMMADRQTAGGYAKIGTVIGPDLAKLAQAKPGDSIRFIRVSDDDAVEALRQETEQYEKIAAALASQANSGKQLTIKINGRSYLVSVEEVK